MSNKPTITVLMAVYNGEKYLKEAIDSILNQTYNDFEFIIINDASTDDTPNILSKYQDQRIRIIRNLTNLGLTKSLNIGLREAKGEYIARMDSDDIALPERLKTEKEYLDNNPEIVCVGGGTKIINQQNEVTGSKPPITDTELLRFFMIIKNQITHSTVLFRKNLIKDEGGYDENFKHAQDYALWSKLLRKGYKISNVVQEVLLYRFHQKSITQNTETKDASYNLVEKITKINLDQYISIDNDTFSKFFHSYHRHKIKSLVDLFRIRKVYSQLEKNYINKERPSVANTEVIRKYIGLEKNNMIIWYIKSKIK